MTPPVILRGVFDDLGVADVRGLEAAARRGPVTVLLLSDEACEIAAGEPPRFPLDERRYLLESIRWVKRVEVVDAPTRTDALARSPHERAEAAPSTDALPGRLRALSESHPTVAPPKVIATGCYDWLHSGHVRFFEEASAFGDLFVTVGNDLSVEGHKGPGHPLLPQEDRRYMVSAIRYVTEALIASGDGWLDALPEVERIEPDFWVVNEDGDRSEKRAFCMEHGIRYEVLRRLPKEGLPARTSSALRGF